MSFLFLNKKKIILSLIVIQIGFIFSENDKCYSIYHCKKCPELDICEECFEGYILNEEKTKCSKSKSGETSGEKSSSMKKEKASSLSSSSKASISSSGKNSSFKSGDGLL